MSKVRGVITENILLLKYQKQAITAAFNAEDALVLLVLLPAALRKLWIYQVLHFIVSRDTSPIGNKVPDLEFCWSTNHGFYTRLEI